MSDTDPFLVKAEEMAPFGERWVGPEKLPHGKDTLVASYKGDCGGRDVEVYCSAWPARLYTVVAMRRGVRVNGKTVPLFKLSTGSGQSRLAAQIAEALSTGMLDLEQ